MEVNVECVPCILNVRSREVLMRYSGTDRRAVEFMLELARKFYKYVDSGNLNVTYIATELFRDVKKFLNDPDPYKEIKHEANRNGMRLYSELKEVMSSLSPRDKLIIAAKTALLGNSIDLGVSGYEPPDTRELASMVSEVEVVGISEIEVLEDVSGKTIIYLLDNCGEAALDKVLAEELRRRGAHVVAVVKSGSFQNDVTVSDVSDLQLHESFDDIIESGTDGSSIFIGELSSDLRSYLKQADLIVSKGMAHYEYLSDFEVSAGTTVMYMLRAKCDPIARNLGVSKNDYVIRRASIDIKKFI